MIKIGIDTGGTFTDLVMLDSETGEIGTVKVPSTPDQPALAPLEALKESGVEPGDVARIVLGTTIATNAGLQKRGATVLYVGTQGVEDVPILGGIPPDERHFDLRPPGVAEQATKEVHAIGLNRRDGVRGRRRI